MNEIDTEQLYRDSIPSKDDNQLVNGVSHSSYMNICNTLYNNMKNDNKTSNIVVGLLLEVKEIIMSNENKKLIYDNLSNRVDNYKNAFSYMKHNKITNLIEPSKRSSKVSNKRKNSIYEISTRHTINKMNNLPIKKQKSCGFCNTANHTITSCPTKCGIGSIID